MIRQQKRNPLTWVFGLALVAGLGWIGLSEFAGEKDPNAVWGTVLLDGIPVKQGQVMFLPNEDKGNSGGKAFADIRKGRYSTMPSQPVSPGPCTAFISVYPDPNQGDALSLSQLADIQSYQVDLEIPEGGAGNFVVRVSSQ
jgi:hypothetical protein